MKDYLILDIQTLLAASKNRKYLETIYLYHEVLVDFLQKNDLTSRALLENGKNIPDNFEIMRSDLTDKGYELIENALDKWSDAINSGKTEVTDTSILDKELKKICKVWDRT